MKFSFTFLRNIFLILTFLFLNMRTPGLLANEIPYLFITGPDFSPYEVKLNDEFQIKNHDNILEIKMESGDIEIPVSSVSSIGFIYKNEEAGINSIKDKQPGKLQIYNLEGRLIKETDSEFPDLSGLMVGKIYIIKQGAISYKYMPYK